MKKTSDLVNLLKYIAEKDYVKNNNRILKMFKDLENDIARDFYTVVVLGEFKHGKSTFVNALLGTPLLPTDILPETATINAIMFSEQPRVSVVTKYGEQKGEPTLEFLKRFSAQYADEKFLNQIRYIKIGYPIEILQNRIVLVDTPGVYDLSEQRSEITYSFIPKANAVIFVLDANAPLKKTEKDFIDEHLIPLGITDILFLLNKYDEVDEEEDSDLIDEVKLKLANAFNVDDEDTSLKKIECLPISASYALEGMTTGNEKLVESSGINEVLSKLKEMLDSNRMETNKREVYKHRFNSALNLLSNELSNIRAIKLADSSELQRAIVEIEKLIKGQSEKSIDIESYAEETKEKIYALTDKSLQFFHKRLEEEICDSVENYMHENFKDFVENTISRSIKKNFETWLISYSPAIDKLLLMLETELARGLSYNFNQKINIRTTRPSGSFRTNQMFVNFKVDDISNVNFKAGAIAAVGSFGLMSIVGTSVLPLIGYVAVPHLKKKFLQERLAHAKIAILPQIKCSLAESVLQLKNELHNYIDNRCSMIVDNTNFAYNKILNDIHDKMRREIELKQVADSVARNEAEQIQRNIDEINAFREKF